MNEAKEKASYFSNSKMKFKPKDWAFNIEIRNGHKTVFSYIFEQEENPNISDDELKEGVFFQIPIGLKTFEFKDVELRQVKLYYEKICFGSCIGKYLEKGQVKGKLINGIWEVEIQIEDKLIQRKFNNR